MFYKTILSFLLAFFVVGMNVPGDTSAVSGATVNLDGKAYMAMLPLNNNGRPDPDGKNKLAVYIAFGQAGDALWGSMTLFDFDALFDESPASQSFKLGCVRLGEGFVKGKKITIYTIDDDEGNVQKDKVTGKVKKNDRIALNIEVAKKKIKLDLIPVNRDGAYESGHYLGNIVLPSAASNNLVTSAIIYGTKIILGIVVFESASEDIFVASGNGTFNPDTGEFAATVTLQDSELPMTGIIRNGVMDYTLTFDEGQVNGKAYNFDDKQSKAPKTKMPKPKVVFKNKDTTIKIKHKFCGPGTLLTLNNPGAPAPGQTAEVYIKEFSFDSKYISAILSISAKATGPITLKVIKPDGKSTLCKPLTLK